MLSRRREAIGLRRAAAVYLLVFLAVVAFARHQHLNSFEDLLSDGRSDSGVFVESGRLPDQSSGSVWMPARVIDDDPCLACFHNDWVTEPIEFLVLALGFHGLRIASVASESPILPVLVQSGRSRAPPPSA